MILKASIFKKALETVKPGIATKEVVEQSSHFAFVDNRIFSYNDELCIRCPVDGLNLYGTTDSGEIYSYISKVTTEDITIEYDDSQLVIKSGKSKCGFVFNSEIKLPIDDNDMNSIGKWKSLPEDFIEAIDFVSESCERLTVNPKTMCVHINEKGFVEGTDTLRLSHWKFAEPLPMPTALIPYTAIKTIVRFKPSKVAKGSGWMHFKNKEDAILSCRLINDTFMNTESVIKESGGVKVVFPDAIEGAIDRAQIFAERQNKSYETLEITVKEKKLIVRSESEIGSWFQEIVPMEYSGDGFTFLITPYLLRSIIKTSKKCEVATNRLRFKEKNWVHITSLKINKQQE